MNTAEKLIIACIAAGVTVVAIIIAQQLMI
jgi:hypothetical protein